MKIFQLTAIILLLTVCNTFAQPIDSLKQEIQKIILRDGSALEIAAQSEAEGVRSLRQSGLHKVKVGLTSLEEVLAVTNL